MQSIYQWVIDIECLSYQFIQVFMSTLICFSVQLKYKESTPMLKCLNNYLTLKRCI